MFRINKVDEGRAIVSFDEETRITGKVSESFRQWCDENCVESFSVVVIDGRNLDFIDSMGIASLIRLYKLMSRTRAKLMITGLSQDISEILSTLRLDSLLDIREEDPSKLIEENA